MIEKTKKMWLYCVDCDFQKAGIYFNPPICPRCKRKLRFLTLTKVQYEKYRGELLKMRCKNFAKKYIRRGEFIDGSY